MKLYNNSKLYININNNPIKYQINVFQRNLMDKKFKILLYESMHQKGTALLEKVCRLAYAGSFDENEIIHQLLDVDAIIIRANGAVSRKIIKAAPKSISDIVLINSAALTFAIDDFFCI